MSDPVRWGFLGAGWIAGKALAPAVHSADGAVLQAVAARDPARARGLRPAGVAYPSYADLLADPSVEAVYIALTNDAHRPWTIAALDAGKHVLCEKPLALSVHEVDEMAKAAVANDRLLVEASWYRWHPRVRLAQRLIADGAIGTVRHVAAGFTFANSLEDNYRFHPEFGGGALYDVGCYAVSAVQWAVGAAPLGEVAARFEMGPTGVDLVADVLLGFDGGDAELRVGISETPAQWLVISGDAGELELRGASFTAWVEDDTELWVSDGRGTERIPVPAVDAYRLMVEEMSSVVRGGPGWLLPLAESRATAAVLDACFSSARAGGAPVAP